jgi:hypothetical protein
MGLMEWADRWHFHTAQQQGHGGRYSRDQGKTGRDGGRRCSAWSVIDMI